jgi:hypothetical protein
MIQLEYESIDFHPTVRSVGQNDHINLVTVDIRTCDTIDKKSAINQDKK